MAVNDGIKIPWKDRKWTRKKYPGILKLTKQELYVLKKLGLNAPINANALSKKTRKAYSFVYETLKDLEFRKIISSKSSISVKGTKETVYDLELEGIFWIIKEEAFARKNDKDSYDLLIRIMKHYGDKLPLVFGKWSYFRDAGFEDLFFWRLWFLVNKHMNRGLYKGTGEYYWLEMEQQMTRYFYLFDFYRLNEPLFKFDVKTWFTVWRNDDKIRDFIIKELQHDLEVIKINQINAQDIISFLINKNDKK